jgi:hypothetical protein
MTNWTLGRTGLVYVAEEATYGTAPTFVATNAFRHLNINLPYNPKNRVDSPARWADPDIRARLQRRKTGSFDISGLFYPSGTLNTVPECAPFLKNGLGAVASAVASSTVSASPAPSTTGCTVASATNFVVNTFITITIASGASAGTYVRFLTGIATNALTWAPALPAAPASLDTVKSGVTYSLATDLPKSLDIAHYAANQNREQLGCVVDKITITLDASQEPRIQITGPSQGFAASAQAKPGSFTTVGTDAGIPSGLFGALLVGDTSLDFLKLVLEINNGMDLQQTNFGTQGAVAFYRKTRRIINLSLDTMVSDQLTLKTASEATTDKAIFAQCGVTEGKQVAIYCPVTQWDVPDTPDSDETNQWAFKGRAIGVSGNDACYVGIC